MNPTNPFKPAEQVSPRVKCLVYGAPGVGKTYLALTAPGPIAVIDTEGGTAFYANRVGQNGLSPFDVLPTKTFAQVEQAIAYLRTVPGAYQTLVVDPVTVLYETLQDAAQHRRAQTRNDAEADLEMLDWQRIKRAYKRLMTDLVNLPMHVVVTAREGDITEMRGKERIKIGFKPDAEKNTGYYFDTILRLVAAGQGKREAIVEKDRTGSHALNARVPGASFAKLFDKALGMEGTGTRVVQSDDEAARIDADTTMGAEELAERDEMLTSIGPIARSGVIAKGDGLRSDLSARMQPNGYIIGFRLEVGDGKAVPQVVATGELGAALYLVSGMNPASLLGARVAVSGELFQVERPGKRSLHRLVLDRIETDEWVLPAPAEVPPEEAYDAAEREATYAAAALVGVGPLAVEAPSLPAFDMDAVDADTAGVR